MVTAAADPLLAATPAWVWAALVMAAFVGVSVATMWLTRLPLRRAPPPVAPRPADAAERPADDESSGQGG